MTTPRWLSHGAAREQLGGVCKRTLRARMLASEAAGLAPAWVDIGLGSRPVYSWDAERLHGWWVEVHAWLRSASAAQAGKSAGETQTVERGPDRSRPRGPRKPSSARCSGQKTSASCGEQMPAVLALVSRRS
jgi:hypothetical protein